MQTIPVCLVANDKDLSIIGRVNAVSMKNGSLVYRLWLPGCKMEYRRSMAAIRYTLTKYCRANQIDNYRLVVA